MQTNTIRRKEDQNLWNFLFSGLFLAVLFGALWLMREMRGGYLTSVPPFDAVLMALAAFRITRLVVYDKITRWFRELFASKREFEKEGKIWVEIVPFDRGFRHTIYDLLQCPWCIGIWAALIVVVFYFIFVWAWTVVLFLAIAGAGSLIQILANQMGWRAETYKLKAYIKEREGARSDHSGL